MKYGVIFTFCISFFLVSAQSEEVKELIQFSGTTLVSVDDKIEPMAFVTVRNKSRKSGSYSGPEGFFSLVVKRGDTVEFSSVGFQKSTLIIPDNIQKNRFIASQIMVRDTQRLRQVTIVPWKNVEELKRAVLDLDVKEDDLVIAYQNLQYERWATLRETMPYDTDESRRTFLATHNQESLRQSTGLGYGNNLLNPFAWMQFFDYLGKNKKKKSTNIENDFKYKD